MSTSSPAKLTTKQQEVYDLSQRGESRKQIAKRLGTTESNVYGHLRKIREALANGTAPEVSGTAPEVSEPASSETAVAPIPLDPTARARMDAEASLRAAIESIHQQVGALTEQAAKYEAALAALQ